MLTSKPRLNRPVAAALLAAAATASPLVQPAQARLITPDVPARISVPAGHKPFLVRHAAGVQIYACRATPTGFAWSFVAPRADLYDERGKRRMTHYAGPTWEDQDGSSVVGARVDGVTVDPTAIPWLLLSATSTASGSDGDRLAKTTFIQRIATTGGLSPAPASCNAATAGAVEEVPYGSDYWFYRARGDG